MEDGHSGALELCSAWAVGPKATDMRLELLALQKAGRFHELALCASNSQFTHQEEHWSGNGEGEVHEKGRLE
jgi:hypothetical protein